MDDQPADEISDPRLWKKDGWVARVVKNEDDDGWAVEMSRRGDAEPALVSPWTMGRDKKNPKPMDHSSFHTLVKTVTEVLVRHAKAAHDRLHRTTTISLDDHQAPRAGAGHGQRVRVDLDIAQDEDDPHAILAAFDEASGEALRSTRVAPNFALTAKSAKRFAQSGET
jgi:hypothetical protein